MEEPQATETELEDGEIEDDGEFLQEIENTLIKTVSPKNIPKKCILFLVLKKYIYI